MNIVVLRAKSSAGEHGIIFVCPFIGLMQVGYGTAKIAGL